MAQDSAVVIGANGGYSTVEDNEGLIIGDGSEISTGVQIGHGSSYNITTMDDNTVQLLSNAGGLVDNAMTLMYANTENVLENYAAQGGYADEVEFMNPEITPAVQSESTANSGKYILGGATLLLLAALAMKGKKSNV